MLSAVLCFRIGSNADPDPCGFSSTALVVSKTTENKEHLVNRQKKGLKTAFHREQQNTTVIPSKQKKEAYRTIR
jgi:hypothetical protein